MHAQQQTQDFTVHDQKYTKADSTYLESAANVTGLRPSKSMGE